MSELFKNLLRKLRRGKELEASELALVSIVLNIKIESTIIAKLYYDKDSQNFCLQYTSEFEKFGLKPFHENSMSPRYTVDTNKVYKSPTLWYAFASRIPNPDRSDYWEALKEAGLSGNEDVLEVIGKISNTSISKPWVFEVDEDNKIVA